LAQYLGFSDFFGRLLTELPNYATRLGNLMLNILRRVLSNPVVDNDDGYRDNHCVLRRR